MIRDYIWRTIATFVARPSVTNWLIRRAKRTPYSPIVKGGTLYMDRFWLFNAYPDTGGSGADRPRWQFPISIRIHHIVMPDMDRHLHDHPWHARTIILRGGYVEQRIMRPYKAIWDFSRLMVDIERNTGDTTSLRYGEFHRITEIAPGGAWTMFITGKYRGTWGFDVDGIKVQWRKYLGLEIKS